MRLRATSQGLIVEEQGSGRWVALAAALDHVGSADPELAARSRDMLAFLRGGVATRAAVAQVLEAVREDDALERVDPAASGLPFQPRSMRAFMAWESHFVASSRMLVKRFFPARVAHVVGAFERVTGKTFPALKPKQQFYDVPSFYLGNHAAMLADGDEMWWPSHTKFLDFELELACVLASPLADATPAEAREAIGGWFVLNDWSARDVQADDARHNVFGPVVKAKTFANSIGCDVVTADELLDWRAVKGRVRVDGQVWCEGTTAGAVHDIGEMLAYASVGERLDAGDVISTGTMPGCCGLELDRWIQPGQAVRLEIDGVGSVENRVSATASPSTASVPRMDAPAA